ncbi:hypothetical protein [Cohnella luojiensis]|uniref:Uncharacterized protein n=1 Tax=Cohnella luojiensis TaxID=652876 RepID=A0A4Y8M6S5_9BACL|nr:hypothetical protein [Cohnella luojiensis]TFE30798.1 hypothetical protein E2980_03195 [Cohnella luojiensis]
MHRYFHAKLKIWGSLLLSASLVSCSSSLTEQPAAQESGDPPAITLPVLTPPQKDKVDTRTNSPSQEIAASPLPSDVKDEKPEIDPAVSTPAVEASTIQPQSTEPVTASDQAFEPKSPSLAGIKLGASDKDVIRKYGLPIDTYPLPGDKITIDIWEYADGFSIGLNESNKVVYVEIVSAKEGTGILGLFCGMDGTQASELLGIESDAQTNVLSVEVAGGWIKLDLDPDTQKVLSLKLLGREIQ